MARSFLVVLIMIGLCCASPLAGAEWRLDYGQKRHQVAYFNATLVKEFEEPAGYGPMAFRLWGSEVWIADSIGGRMLCLGADGKLRRVLAIPGVASNTLLEDFALVQNGNRLSGIWVADGADCLVRFLRVSDGKALTKVGGMGSEPGKFLQIHQIEAGAAGRLYVGDYGRGVISVFSPAGKLLYELPWQCSGFALDARENLVTVRYFEGVGYQLQTYDTHGVLLESVHLGLPMCQNPRLWGFDREGNALVSFIPAGGFKGKLHLYSFAKNGMNLNRVEFAPPKAMNRFLDVSPGQVHLASADFDLAPRGQFTIKPLANELPPKGKK